MALPDYSGGSNISIAGSNAGAMGTLMQLGKNRGVKYIKEGISTVHQTKRVKTGLYRTAMRSEQTNS